MAKTLMMLFFGWVVKSHDACWQISDLPHHGRCIQQPLRNWAINLNQSLCDVVLPLVVRCRQVQRVAKRGGKLRRGENMPYNPSPKTIFGLTYDTFPHCLSTTRPPKCPPQNHMIGLPPPFAVAQIMSCCCKKVRPQNSRTRKASVANSIA